METNKEIFKLLIKEFHEQKSPCFIKRDHELPDLCSSLAAESSETPSALPSPPSLIILIMGPRRCGKTYFFYQLIDNLCSHPITPIPRQRLLYINFEDDRLMPLNVSDLASLLEAYFELYPDNREKEIFLFLDEIQQIEGWELFLRRLLDQGRMRLFITGSPSGRWSCPLSSALSCRILELAITPLSFKEFLAFKGVALTPDFPYSHVRFKIRNLLDEYLAFGGYPEVVLTDSSLKLRTLKNHYDMLIYKELAEEFSIRNIPLLKELFKSLLLHTGSEFSINSYFLGVQPKLHISRETILDYVSCLEKKELIGLVPVFSDSAKVRQVNPKKVYSFDNGIHNAVSFPFPHYEERLVKNLVFQKLRRSGKKLFYWRKRGEVDFVARENGKLQAINISYGRELRSEEAASLLEFQSFLGRRDVDLTIITRDAEKMERGIRFVPLWKWLLI